MARHAVILGCGRSGTSIFGELFEAMGDYQYLSEPAFADLLALSFERATAIKVPMESEGYPSTPGLSFPLPVLEAAFPEPSVFFWQVRHPLDAIASLKVGIDNNWGHHPRPPDWEEWLSRPLIERCAHHWAYINTFGFSAVKNQSTVCRFEDMLAQPLAFAQRICTLVEVDYTSCAETVDAWADRVQNSNNEKFIEAMTSRHYSRADHSVRVDRWRENLGDDEIEAARPMVSAIAEEFSYAL
jgi:hypothetical protein